MMYTKYGGVHRMKDFIKRKAYGKINLGLDVLRKREDGYHEVRMIMQSVSLYDTITIRKSDQPGIRLKTNRHFLPTDSGNLIVRAAMLMQKEYDLPGGMDITLLKRIPVAAGMAGGSTDAAAVFTGINEMYDLGLSGETLKGHAVKLGADIPYCIDGGTALSEGIGEILTKLPDMPKCYILLAKPGIDVSTKFVYGNLRAAELKEHPDISRMIKGIEGGSLSEITDSLGNVLETVTVPAYPVIDRIKALMCEEGADGALMSGSGPTVFGIFTEKEQAKRAAARIKRSGLAKQIYITKPVTGK